MKKKSPFDLHGKSILVTGASSGIGKQIAISLSEMGAKLILTARNEQRLREVQGLIATDNCEIIIGDLTSDETISKIITNVGKLDGIVHSAGIMSLLPFKYIKLDTLDTTMAINFRAPVNLTIELLKHKKLLKGSSIVFISSIIGSTVGGKANSMYAASKGALSGMIKGIALDLAKNKIRVNEIAPGMINTEVIHGDLADMLMNDSMNEDIKKYPLGSYGSPEDVANACIYLVSDASKWVTGSKLVIDGGFTAQ